MRMSWFPRCAIAYMYCKLKGPVYCFLIQLIGSQWQLHMI